ncbi:MAG: NAD(+) synthase [Bifidobacteriaceae bacterium]|nr:NAD(+) synthase [Bifidobacteriaceae bacterium]
MNYDAAAAGFVRVAACSFPVRLADPQANAAAIAAQAQAAAQAGASLAVFPELSVSGYSLDDLFMQSAVINAAERALTELAAACADLPIAIVAGAPLRAGHRLYNCAVVIAAGRVLGAVPKSYLPNYREFYEHRQFASGVDASATIHLPGQAEPIRVSPKQLFDIAVTPSADAARPATAPSADAARTATAPSADAARPAVVPPAEGAATVTAAPAEGAEAPPPTGPTLEAPTFRLGVEICEDLWVPISPSAEAALAGAEIIANISGSPITVAKARERRRLSEVQSAKLICGYVYAASGKGESSTDLSWDGQTIVHERGELLAEGPRFSDAAVTILADIDLALIRQDRLRQGTFDDNRAAHAHRTADLQVVSAALPPAQDAGISTITVPLRNGRLRGDQSMARCGAGERADGIVQQAGATGGESDDAAGQSVLVREIARFPFVPDDPERLDQDCYEAYNIQVSALVQRLAAIGRPKIVIGLSGGLDSSQAVIVAAQAMDRLGRPRRDILAYTMPGFGTTEATKANATALATALGVSFEELDIRPAANQMLADLDHPFAHGRADYDITFENVQAGLRTDYLFRLANHRGGIVLGTGDLSELALGWCTYGVGDQMSHYNVNAGVPKTLIQYLIRWVIKTAQFDNRVSATLQAVVDTEISPELVPPDPDGEIQSTESAVGPYALQDFALYYTLRFGLTPSQVFFRLRQAWEDPERGRWPQGVPDADRRGYEPEELLHWLEVFYQRFFSQQFKRSALPNGPKVVRAGALSPRGDWRQPSDVPAGLWRREIEALRSVYGGADPAVGPGWATGARAGLQTADPAERQSPEQLDPIHGAGFD